MNGRYREPARSVRAINVADVHVLTQDMVHHAQRRRLLVFCDNRQDAAFQAGWMKDHARRFRLRAMMADGIKARPRSVGDLVGYLDDLLETTSRCLGHWSRKCGRSHAGSPEAVAGTSRNGASFYVSRYCGRLRYRHGRLLDSNHGAE